MAIEDETVGCHHQLNGREFKQTLGDREGQRGLECCSPRGHKESDTPQQLNNNNKMAAKHPLLGRQQECKINVGPYI